MHVSLTCASVSFFCQEIPSRGQRVFYLILHVHGQILPEVPSQLIKQS